MKVLQEANGKTSASRIFMFAVTMPATIAIVAVWCVISVREQAMQVVPASVITLIGVLLAQKVGNRVAEALDKK